MSGIRILGTGSYVPPKVLTNNDLQAMGLDTSDEWIFSRTGVRERRIAEPDVCTSDLACQASLKALEAAGLKPADLDLIIVATITPDTCCPAAANWLQAKLGAPQAVTFDVAAACSGFVFAFHIAAQFIKARTCRHVLVAAAEVMSRTVDWKDRSTCILGGTGPGRQFYQGARTARSCFPPTCTRTEPPERGCCCPAGALKRRPSPIPASTRGGIF